MEDTTKKPKKNKFLLIFICIFLSLVLLFGAGLGITTAVLNSNAVVRYGSCRIDRGEARYLAAYYKGVYIRSLVADGVSAYDTPYFWNSEAENGKTHLQNLKESFGDYLSYLVITNTIFDDNSSLGKADRKIIERTSKQILSSSNADTKEKFNAQFKPYGYGYADFLDALEIIYKSEGAINALYGLDGEMLREMDDECNEYLDEYAHTYLIFIRRNTAFIVDGEGNRVPDKNGNDSMRDLTEEEKAQREEMINTLRTYIAEDRMSAETLRYYLERSDGDKSMHLKGYYFNENAEATKDFAEVFPEIVSKAYEMRIGEYAEVECPEIDGVCFIYKDEAVRGAYLDTEDPFFSDFYKNATAYLFPRLIEDMEEEVIFGKNFDKLDLLSIPKDTNYTVKEWVK